ncbi:MAG: chitobiase/beta-hexosaminidase C-terminal domain-containing protein [Kiritimatiellae bacterium]|nr:chitobiase/beta-hexosaminidase C-terminal domain-containing protein [Kiritimatiellia bacterium]
MNRLKSCGLGVAALSLMLSMNVSEAALVRQYGAFGIVTYDPIATPVISPESGTIFADSQTVTISCATDGVAIYYTTDGSEPTKDSTAYSRFKIHGKATVKAVAYDDAGRLYSEVVTAEYALGTCANPVILPEGGTAVAADPVIPPDNDEDFPPEDDEDEEPPMPTPVVFHDDEDEPSTPEYTPSTVVSAGSYVFRRSGQKVTISQSGAEGTIRYTLDGTDPTAESAAYSGAVSIDATTTIKAKVFSDNYFDSETVTVVFTREWDQVATPEITVAASFTGSKTRCEIACATEGASIFYTLDGSDPTSASMLYDGELYITESCTVKAIALLDDCIDSGIASGTVTKVWVIGDSMGAPDQEFTTSGDDGKAFYRVTDASAPDGEAMKSGAITHNQTSVLSTTVTGAGTLTFAWRTSCEKDPDDAYEWDHAELAVDGTVVRRLDGVTAWQTESVAIAGDSEHTVEWRYVKDDMESAGEDAAWVTGFRWVQGSANLAFSSWAAENGVTGAWDEKSGGVYNVFRYMFNVPEGDFEEPIIDIAFEDGKVVVKTPDVANAAGVAVSVVESSDVAGEAVTATVLLDATGRVVFTKDDAAASRFYRLSVTMTE